MALRKRLIALCALSIFAGTRANAVPQPPPSPAALAVIKAFILASVDKNLPLYASLLSDQFVGADAEAGKFMTRPDWLASTAHAFQNRWFQTKILKVFYGYHVVGTGLQYRVMILERLANYPDPPHSDCCTFYRTETLVLDGIKISRISRSISFGTELSDMGKRTEIPN